MSSHAVCPLKNIKGHIQHQKTKVCRTKREHVSVRGYGRIVQVHDGLQNYDTASEGRNYQKLLAVNDKCQLGIVNDKW